MARVDSRSVARICYCASFLNIYLNDLFYLAESTNVCNFGTFYACDKDLISLINRLEHDSYIATEVFEKNYMKLSQDKCQLPISGK